MESEVLFNRNGTRVKEILYPLNNNENKVVTYYLNGISVLRVASSDEIDTNDKKRYERLYDLNENYLYTNKYDDSDGKIDKESVYYKSIAVCYSGHINDNISATIIYNKDEKIESMNIFGRGGVKYFKASFDKSEKLQDLIQCETEKSYFDVQDKISKYEKDIINEFDEAILSFEKTLEQQQTDKQIL